jgi:hypothetical protein
MFLFPTSKIGSRVLAKAYKKRSEDSARRSEKRPARTVLKAKVAKVARTGKKVSKRRVMSSRMGTMSL